jgi:sulfatase modifying factor 1
MKMTSNMLAMCVMTAVLAIGSVTQAAITIDTVAVGDAGNAGELSGAGVAGGFGPDRICGSVGYAYNIGKYEVTAGQYTAFLNAVAATDTYGLYHTEMWNRASGCKIQRSGSSGSYTYSVATDWANRPVNFVSYWDSCRFANWLHNGQPMGLQDASTTEGGAYALNGYNGEGGQTIGREAGAKWAVTSEDEWYKAAYYKSGGIDAGYWKYPTRSDATPANQVLNPDPGNSANFCLNWTYTISYPYCRTEVGEFENSASPYGTFDQSGNVWEWTEATISGANRGIRGGSFDLTIASYQQGLFRNYTLPTYEAWSVGFRVCRVAPEPSCPSADLSGDCFVNMKDFALLASAWQRTGCVAPDWCGGADINTSGAAGLDDLAELVSQWLTGVR